MSLDLKLYFVAVNQQQTNMLDFFFTRQCKGQFQITPLEKSNAFLVDMDQYDADKELESISQQYPEYPIVQLSLKEPENSQIYWVKKPISTAQLKETLLAAAEHKVSIAVEEVIEETPPVSEPEPEVIEEIIEEMPPVSEPEPEVIEEMLPVSEPEPEVIEEIIEETPPISEQETEVVEEPIENKVIPETEKKEEEEKEISFSDFNIDDILDADLLEEEIVISPMLGQNFTQKKKEPEPEKEGDSSELPSINDKLLFEDPKPKKEEGTEQLSNYNLFNHGSAEKEEAKTNKLTPPSFPEHKKSTTDKLTGNVSFVEYNPEDYLYHQIAYAFQLSKEERSNILIQSSSGNILIDSSKGIATIEVNELRLRTLSSVPITQANLALEKAPDNYLAAKNTRPIIMRKEELIWKTALWASRGRVPIGTDLEIPVKLRLWSDSKQINNYPHAKKIAALWTQKPRSLISTIAITALPQRNIFNFYSAAMALGLLQLMDAPRKLDKTATGNLMNKVFRSR